DGFGVEWEAVVASAHRSPERVTRWVREAPQRGVQVIIAAAGLAAHLPGVVAAQTTLPVIGLPIEAGALRGVDALYSIVQMPPGAFPRGSRAGIGRGRPAAAGNAEGRDRGMTPPGAAPGGHRAAAGAGRPRPRAKQGADHDDRTVHQARDGAAVDAGNEVSA